MRGAQIVKIGSFGCGLAALGLPWLRKWMRNIGVGTIPTILPTGRIDRPSYGTTMLKTPTKSRFLGNHFY
jgi:hypothetical protein